PIVEFYDSEYGFEAMKHIVAQWIKGHFLVEEVVAEKTVARVVSKFEKIYFQ
ncbi:hypothetical protein HK098_007909, partial [Nowakowskiella sp. JEL0407]